MVSKKRLSLILIFFEVIHCDSDSLYEAVSPLGFYVASVGLSNKTLLLLCCGGAGGREARDRWRRFESSICKFLSGWFFLKKILLPSTSPKKYLLGWSPDSFLFFFPFIHYVFSILIIFNKVYFVFCVIAVDCLFALRFPSAKNVARFAEKETSLNKQRL